MAKLTAHIVLIVVAVIFSLCECVDDCFYHPGYPGKRCFNEQTDRYTCCPLDHQCQDGNCLYVGGSPSSNHLPLHTSILIAVGACIIAVVGVVIIGGILWNRKQTQATKQTIIHLKSFSHSNATPSRTASSAGFRNPTSTSEP